MTTKQTGETSNLTVIGQGTTIKGEVDFDNGARILGVFEGIIRSKGEVQIGDTARCKADVEAESVVIEGTIEGNINARQRLSLRETAHFTGDITATKLHVDEGASFVGHCCVGENVGKADPARTTKSAQTAQTRPAAPAVTAEPKITTTVDQDEVDFKPPWKETAESGAA